MVQRGIPCVFGRSPSHAYIPPRPTLLELFCDVACSECIRGGYFRASFIEASVSQPLGQHGRGAEYQSMFHTRSAKTICLFYIFSSLLIFRNCYYDFQNRKNCTYINCKYVGGVPTCPQCARRSSLRRLAILSIFKHTSGKPQQLKWSP